MREAEGRTIMGHVLIAHARNVIGAHLDGRSWRALLPLDGDGPAQGCFVSLKLGGRLRGCIGTLVPVWPTLAEEVAENALGAATRDPRFPPLRSDELAGLRISIDLLGPLEPVDGPHALDAARYGVVVRSGERCGVLLPAIPGVDTVAGQLAICREKAGIGPAAPVVLHRFAVQRLRE